MRWRFRPAVGEEIFERVPLRVPIAESIEHIDEVFPFIQAVTFGTRQYPHGIYETREETKLSIIEYIEMFYNSERVHQALGYKTPNGFESEYFDQEMELTTISR